MSKHRNRRKLTRESDLWDSFLLAEYLGVRVETMYAYASDGRLPGAFQIGGPHTDWRFPNTLKASQPMAGLIR